MGPRRPDKVSHGQRIGLHLVHPDAFHACAVDRMNDSAASSQVAPVRHGHGPVDDVGIFAPFAHLRCTAADAITNLIRLQHM